MLTSTYYASNPSKENSVLLSSNQFFYCTLKPNNTENAKFKGFHAPAGGFNFIFNFKGGGPIGTLGGAGVHLGGASPVYSYRMTILPCMWAW